MIFSEDANKNYITDILNSPLLIKCFAYFLDLIKDTELPNSVLIEESKDLNDYKIAASLAFYAIKSEETSIKDLFITSIERISKKPLTSSNKLIYDPMAIISFVLVVEKFNLTQYNIWCKDLVNEFYFHCNRSKTMLGVAEAIREYINNQDQMTQGSDEYLCLKLWLITQNDYNAQLNEQSAFTKRIWFNNMPYFNEPFLDLLSINLVNRCISKRFDVEFVDSTDVLNRIKAHSIKQAKMMSMILTFIITIGLTYGVYFIGQAIWDTTYVPDKTLKENMLFFLLTLGGIGGYILSCFKLLPTLYEKLTFYLDWLQQKYRGIK